MRIVDQPCGFGRVLKIYWVLIEWEMSGWHILSKMLNGFRWAFYWVAAFCWASEFWNSHPCSVLRNFGLLLADRTGLAFFLYLF